MGRPARPIRLALPFWPAYEVAFLARELGYYDPARVELVETHAPLDVLRAYRHGVVDVAPMPLNSVLQLASHDPTHRVVAVIDFSAGGDAVLTRPGITTGAGLKGRAIGVEPNALGAYMLARFLADAGLTRDDLTVLLIDFADHLHAFRSGRVDALVTFEPLRTVLLQSGAHEVFSSRAMPGEIADVLVVPAQVLDRRSEDVAHLVDGWLRAVDYLRSDMEAGARRIAGRAGTGFGPRTPAQVLAQFGGLLLLGRDENRRLLVPPAPELARTAQGILESLQAQKVIVEPPDIARLLDGRFVRVAP